MSKTTTAKGDTQEVLIGGAGIAAAAVAVRLCALGFRPVLVARSSRIFPALEAIPEAAMPLFSALGLLGALRDSGAVVVDGFENHWNSEELRVRPGRWIHVERSRLAQAAIAVAVKRGATLHISKSMPALDAPAAESRSPEIRPSEFAAIVDATGRSAIWSRPIRRAGNQVADLFEDTGRSTLRARIVRNRNNKDEWGYRIGWKDLAACAIIRQDGAQRAHPDTPMASALGVRAEGLTHTGRRPAFPQWSENPIRANRLAVGDAALAYDPIAGQGICFALSSALAAAAVIEAWRRANSDFEIAERFYRDFVRRARQRHLEHRRQMFISSPRGERDRKFVFRKEDLPPIIRFSGRSGWGELNIAGEIEPGEVMVLPDQSCARWVNRVDLVRLRNLSRAPIASERLLRELAIADLPETSVVAALHWCLQHGVISAADAC